MAGVGSLVASDIERALKPGILYTVCGAVMLLMTANIIIIRMKGKEWTRKRQDAGL
ncbi:hypothetical protein BJV82DRAFT_621587 [Fennellomyces sp. T-0311]|nr:hypothetical protein BJV82DRAFT_621587 [Fennellomyces sp. T-0311]